MRFVITYWRTCGGITSGEEYLFLRLALLYFQHISRDLLAVQFENVGLPAARDQRAMFIAKPTIGCATARTFKNSSPVTFRSRGLNVGKPMWCSGFESIAPHLTAKPRTADSARISCRAPCVSTHSATVVMSNACAKSMIVETSVQSSRSSGSRVVKLRSIFKVSIGSSDRLPRDENTERRPRSVNYSIGGPMA